MNMYPNTFTLKANSNSININLKDEKIFSKRAGLSGKKYIQYQTKSNQNN